MINLFARLSRTFPLIFALIVLAIIIYFVISRFKTPTHAKYVLIKAFIIICSAITIIFALISLYALADNNGPVLELAFSCFIIGIIGLAITLICKWVFTKNHPHYRFRANATATTQDPGISKGTVFWKIYDILGNFRPKQK